MLNLRGVHHRFRLAVNRSLSNGSGNKSQSSKRSSYNSTKKNDNININIKNGDNSNINRNVKDGNSKRNVFELPRLTLSDEEEELFNIFTSVVKDEGLSTTVRVAGGWVRDKILGIAGKDDIDVALDNISGKDFAILMSRWSQVKGNGKIKYGIIQQNPEKSKHL